MVSTVLGRGMSLILFYSILNILGEHSIDLANGLNLPIGLTTTHSATLGQYHSLAHIKVIDSRPDHEASLQLVIQQYKPVE